MLLWLFVIVLGSAVVSGGGGGGGFAVANVVILVGVVVVVLLLLALLLLVEVALVMLLLLICPRRMMTRVNSTERLPCRRWLETCERLVETKAANFSCVLFCATCVFVCHRLCQADVFHVPSAGRFFSF